MFSVFSTGFSQVERDECCEGFTQFCHVQSGQTIDINGNNCNAHINSTAPGHEGDHCGPCTCEEEKGMPCVDPNPDDCIGNYAYDEDCNCVGTPIPDCEEEPVCCEGFTQFCHVQSGQTIDINGNNCNAHINSTAPGHEGDHCGPCTCEEEKGPCTGTDPCQTYAYDEDCNCVGTPIPDCGGGCDMVGDPCVGSDPCQTYAYDEDCNCVGTPIPGCGVDTGCPVEGNPCNDGDPCTKDDKYNADCECEGVADNDDYDSDGIINCMDGCPFDRNKVSPGVCGCGVPESGDSDGDGVADCLDPCPNGPFNNGPGYCSCGVPEIYSVRLLNKRNCNGNNTSNVGDDTFVGDLKITFYDAPTDGAIRIKGDANRIFDFPRDNTKKEFELTDFTFKATGKRLNIVVEYVGLEQCRFVSRNLTALAPCSMPPCSTPRGVRVAHEYAVDAATVTWQGKADDMIYEFEYRKSGGSWKSEIVQTTEIKLHGLGFDQQYDYRVRALCCDSDWSSYKEGSFTTKEASQSSCVMMPNITNIICKDNGTPSAQDDYYRFRMKVSGIEGNSYRFAEGVFPASGQYNKFNYFRTVPGKSKDLVLIDNQKNQCRTTFDLEIPADCAQNCNITGIFVENLYRCFDNGTGVYLKDDYIEADVTVTFQNAPKSGTLQLAEGAEEIVNVASLGSTNSYTFKRARLNYGESNFKIMAAFATSDVDIEWGAVTSCSAFIDNVFPCNPCPIEFCESPEGLNASPMAREATVYWNDSGENRFYEVAYRVDNGQWSTKLVLSNMAKLEGLKPSSDYEFKVRAYCSSNSWSAYSSSNFATTEFQELESRSADITGMNINQFVHFYPNPVAETLVLDYTIPETIDFNRSTIQVYDLLGQMKISKRLEAQESLITLDMGHLNNGIYMLTLNMNGLIFTGKIVKEDLK